VNRKSDKVEEPTVPYTTKKVGPTPAAPKSGDSHVKRVDDAAFKKAMNKVFDTHSELMRKLAQ